MLSLAEQFAQIDELPAQAPDPFAPLFARIETFNEDCARLRPAPGKAGDSATSALRNSAERVASHYQRKFVKALQVIFYATAAAIVTFVMYGDLLERFHPVVVLYLAVSCVAVITYLAARRGRWQDRAQDYRALEIGLHVQQAWDAAGLRESVADYYIRRQRGELDWIRDAIRTAHTVDRQRGFDEAQAVAAVRAFVTRQYLYFAGTASSPGAAERERAKARLHHRFNAIALRISFALSVCLIAYGLAAWLAPERVNVLPEEAVWHGYLMFSIGVTAAAAALFHDYSSRRGHAQQARRYDLMAAIYRRALNALDEADGQAVWSEPDDGPAPSRLANAQACIRELGHEALSENGDWLLMHREFPIQLISMH